METSGLNPNKQVGNALLSIIYLVCPIISFVFVFIVMFYGNIVYEMGLNLTLLFNYALGFGCLLGLLAQIVLFIAGVMKEHFVIEIRRLQDFFFDIKFSINEAFNGLWISIKENGIWFHIMFWSTAITAFFTFIGFWNLVAHYN